MSFRVTLPCTRAQGEAIGALDTIAGLDGEMPVLVANEPDPDRPDDWRLHAYFEQRPSPEEIDALASLGSGRPEVEQLAYADWVTISQSGLEPLRAGRFHVHTPAHPPMAGAISFQIDAGLAFGTGQHATTAGCLEVLDALASNDRSFGNIADVGAGTGLLAFAALALWPQARCIATDIDPVAVEVARDNAVINRVPLGSGPGQLLLAQADGMNSPLLAGRAPFDLLIANILAGPLIDLAPDFAGAIAPGGTAILAGLLDSQADVVAAAYAPVGLTPVRPWTGEWPVLELQRRR